MAKAKARRRPTKSGTTAASAKWGGHYAKKRRRADRIRLTSVAVLAVTGGGLYWWQARADVRAFEAFAADGAPALADVKTLPSEGTTHLAPGRSWHYGTPFPTSGPHDPMWAVSGYYEDPLRSTQLVHALEHGNIVIYYDAPGEEARETLKRWTGLFDGG